MACVFFLCQPQTPGAKRPDTLTVKSLTDWKDGKEMLIKHAGLQCHLCSEAKLSEFVRVYRTPIHRCNHILTTESQKVVQKYCAVLLSIIRCIELCARQGIALVGHRDDSMTFDFNQGNFRAVLSFRREVDEFLDSHLKYCHATMISKTVENELLITLYGRLHCSAADI